MIIDVNSAVVFLLATLFGFFVSCFENPKRSAKSRVYRLLASVILSFLLVLLETNTMVGVVAIMAFWGISFSKILHPNNNKEGDVNEHKS